MAGFLLFRQKRTAIFVDSKEACPVMNLRILIFIPLLVCSIASQAQVVKRDLNHKIAKEGLALKIDPDSKWYNTDRERNLNDQPGRMIMAHLWNPELPEGEFSIVRANEIRDKYGVAVVVSILDGNNPLYENELVVQNLIKQHRVNHPVLVSKNFLGLEIMNEIPYPSFIGFDSDANSFGRYNGLDEMDLMMSNLDILNEGVFKEMNMRRTSLFPKMSPGEIERLFHYPHDAVCSDELQMCFVADTYNNQVTVWDANGALLEVIGTGTKGSNDDRFGNCQFNRPQGLAIDEKNRRVYISDSHNHTIRMADLDTRELKTILGNGERLSKKVKWVDSTSTSINFPTGLSFRDGQLYIAMTGEDRIWQYDVLSRRAKPILGDRKRQSLDGSRGECSFNLPTGIIALDNDQLYVWDSGSDQLRFVDELRTVVTLELPEVDGKAASGVSRIYYHKEKLYIPDTYNNRLLVWNQNKLTRLAGTGKPGLLDDRKGKSEFFHPVAASMLNRSLVVLDKNNQALRTVHPKKGRTKTMKLTDLAPIFMVVQAYDRGYQKHVDELFLKPGTNSLFVKLELPEHLEWYDAGRNEVDIEASNFNRLVSSRIRRGYVELECKGDEINTNVNLQLYMTVKDKRDDQIYFRSALLFIPFFVDDDGDAEHDIKWSAFEEMAEP